MLSTALLGLLVGALLAEGFLLVPLWRSLSAEEFYAAHPVHGPRLYRFFAPLTIGATFLATAAAVVCVATAHTGRWWTGAAGILAGSMVILYFAYFRAANARFATAALTADELSRELARWESRHWVRVVLGVVAFAAALVGLHKGA